MIKAFKSKEAQLELDRKLEDFVDMRIEVSNYWKVVKNKYEALDLPEVSQVEEIIEKLKNKHQDGILV